MMLFSSKKVSRWGQLKLTAGIVICHLSFVICHLSFVICHLSFVICHTREALSQLGLCKGFYLN
ncbi:hypothetical protein [Coleofasciculus sp. F4-SAH-05]|uniref:hypothetical protein n=1 Tax=Coleofasciculus sp. F4-SAH-05 TaxID=3069525 RepID=UPI0032FEB5F3